MLLLGFERRSKRDDGDIRVPGHFPKSGLGCLRDDHDPRRDGGEDGVHLRWRLCRVDRDTNRRSYRGQTGYRRRDAIGQGQQHPIATLDPKGGELACERLDAGVKMGIGVGVATQAFERRSVWLCRRPPRDRLGNGSSPRNENGIQWRHLLSRNFRADWPISDDHRS
jgi:hypothetical protein